MCRPVPPSKTSRTPAHVADFPIDMMPLHLQGLELGIWDLNYERRTTRVEGPARADVRVCVRGERSSSADPDRARRAAWALPSMPKPLSATPREPRRGNNPPGTGKGPLAAGWLSG